MQLKIEEMSTRTNSTSDHQDISSRSSNSNSNKGPNLEGALAGARIRATFTSCVASSRCRIGLESSRE